MLKHLISKEIKYTLSFPLTQIALLVFFLFLTFIYSRGMVIIGIVAENEFVNSPHAITATSIFFTLLAMVIALPIFHNAANREYQHGFAEILFATPISKFHFFAGRFIAAFCLMLIPALFLILINIIGVKIGLSIGSILPEEATNFRFSTFAKTFLFIALPNIFIVGSIVFGLSLWLKNLAYSILGIALLNICYMTGLYGLSSDLNNFALGALIDPFGEFAYNLDTRYFSIAERNTKEVELSGYLLKNRLLWLALSAAFLLFTYRRFTFLSAPSLFRKSKKTQQENSRALAALPQYLNQAIPKVKTSFSPTFSFGVFKNLFQVDLRNIVTQIPYLLMLAGVAAFQIVDFINRQHDYGVAALPLTYKMIDTVRDYDALLMLFLFFYAGETVWNSRNNNFDELIDPTPHHSIEMIFAKILASWSAILLIYVLVFLEMIGIQLSQGFIQIDFGHYLTEIVFQIAPFLLVWACVTIFIQLLVNNKFLGFALSIGLIMGQSYLISRLNWESNMLKIGGNGGAIFSDLNRYGPFLKGNLWFNFYWMLFGLLLLFPGTLLWLRGKETSIRKRWKNRRDSWSPKLAKAGILLFLLWGTTAGFVYYNTQILNTYSTAPTTNEAKTQYELKYKKYSIAALPQIVEARFFVDFFPKERNLKSKSQLLLKNNTALKIDTLYFSTRDINRQNGWEHQIKIPDAQLLLNDTFSGFQIYVLQEALLPQDSFWIETHANYNTRGFENTVSNQEIVSNGSFLHHNQIIPFIGYRKASEIRDHKERQLRGLPKRVETLPLETGHCKQCFKNQLTEQHSWMPMEATISTSEDQIALTAGSLIKKWNADGRSYFHYRVDHPSLLFNSFISAQYEVATRKWKGIDLEVYYDKKHPYNVNLMLNEMENAMDYYTKNFGSYFHQQVRIIEFPQYSNSAQAFPGTMPYSESRGFVLDMSDPNSNNPIASTIGHEIGHQWWGHQIVGADLQGSSMLTESFAEYSSLMIMKKEKGIEGMIDFLKYDYDSYLFHRQNERNQEMPLYKVEEQAYLYYRKGSVVMYTLAELIGEDKVNRSLRNFLEAYRYQPAPFPRSTDYLTFLEKEVPDSLQYLISDLFYDIIFFENRIQSATFKALSNGKYQINLSLHSQKIKLGEDNLEKTVSIQDWFELGVFSETNKSIPFALKKIKIDQAQMNFIFLLDQKPQRVELDPRYLFFDRNREDNGLQVVEERN